MITLRSMRQMRTPQNLASFRAGARGFGVPTAGADRLRRVQAEVRLVARWRQHRWLARQWRLHFRCAAGALRVLPPTARAMVLKEF